MLINLLKQFIKSKKSNAKELRLRKLKGDDVYCCCCEHSFKFFLPFGLKKRVNALCPSCSALERHRLHWHYMQHKLNVFDESAPIRLLHVAPETMFFNKFKSIKSIEYVPCAKFGEGYEDRYPEGTIDVDLTAIQFPDDHFDAIYCSHVLEHIPDDVSAMKEMLRVLKPGGWALLQVPLDVNRAVTYEDFTITDPQQREKAFGQVDHVRVYGKDYKDRLSSAGFEVQVDGYVRQFSEGDLFRLGFEKDEDLYVCFKR